MASKTDLILDLRKGYSPREIATRHQCSLAWVEIVAGTRQPDSASNRRRAAGKPTGTVVPFIMPVVTSRIAPASMWRMGCPLGRIARAA